MQSLNTSPADLQSRSHQARIAGEAIYGSVARSGSDSFPSGYSYSNTNAWDRQACCGIMSPVRRTFCLFVLFDLILIFILWLIYTQLCGMGVEDIKKEITSYYIKFSMFDGVMCAACRFVPLLLAYALFKLRLPWVVAVTTFLTCGFLIAKVVLFNPDSRATKGQRNVMSYGIVVVSFVITWIETWFLDFKVLPREQQAREKEAAEASRWYSERSPLLGHHHNQGAPEFRSLPDTPEGSDDEGVPNRGYHSLPGTRNHSRATSVGSLALSLGDEEKEYQELANEVWDFILRAINLETGWKIEGGEDQETGIVKSQVFPECGKLFRLECIVDISPAGMFDILHTKLEDTPKWNPTVLDCRVLQNIDERLDISYQVAAEAVSGMVSSRDFVTLRYWGEENGTLITCGKHVKFPDMPPTTKHVRGENGPGGWIFRPIPDQPNKCLFIWLLNTNLNLPGGWVAQALAERALCGVQMDFLKYLHKHIEDLNSRQR